MSTVTDITECINCGDKQAYYEYDTTSGENYICCSVCGHTIENNKTIVYGKKVNEDEDE